MSPLEDFIDLIICTYEDIDIEDRTTEEQMIFDKALEILQILRVNMWLGEEDGETD